MAVAAMSAPVIYDPQQHGVYRASSQYRREFHESLSQAEVRDYAAQLMASSWWQKRALDTVPVRFEFLSESGSATSEWVTGLIRLPEWAMCRITVAHELAHQLLGRFHPELDFELQPHGPMFVQAWLGLLHLSVEAPRVARLAELLRAAHVECDGTKEVAHSDAYGIGLRLWTPNGILCLTHRYFGTLHLDHWRSIRPYVLERMRDQLRYEADKSLASPA